MIFDLADSLQRSRDSQKTYPTFESHYCEERASLIAQLVKNLPAIQEIPVWFLGWEDSLEKG